MSPRPWSGAEQRRLETLVLQGLSNQAIGKALGRSKWSIQRRLFDLHIRRPKQEEPVDFTIRMPAALYDELAQTSKRLGMSKSFFVRSAIEAKMENSK